jgi:CRISPR-associated protein Csb1
MELALRAARERGELRFPPIVADFSREFPHIGRITALDAPHRIADAIFRESLRNGKPFRDSEEGQCFAYATARNARASSSLCGPRSTLQQRFAFLPLPQGHGSFRPTFAT